MIPQEIISPMEFVVKLVIDVIIGLYYSHEVVSKSAPDSH